MGTNRAGFTGFLLCFTAIIFGIATNGGIQTIVNFIHLPSFIVTVGGALFAVLITADSFSDFLLGIKGFGHALFGRMTDIDTVISFIYEMSDQARKEGLLSLEGVLSIQAGENTRIIQEKIKAIINEDHET